MNRNNPPPGYEWAYPAPRRKCRAHEMVYLLPCNGHELHLSEAWAEYDAVTLPARVALMREIANMLDDVAYEPCGPMVEDLRRRADALEGQR